MSSDNNISQYKSAISIVKHFSSLIKDKIINSNTEKISQDASSFVSLHESAIGDFLQIGFNEMNFYKRECNISTAILPRTLFANLIQEDLSLVFGQPSKTNFFLAFYIKDILKYAVKDEKIESIKRLRINKDSSFVIYGQYSFVLDHSIDIEIMNPDSINPTFKATFDTSDKYTSSLSDVNNNLLNVKKLKINKADCIGFDVPARQYKREYYETIVNTVDVTDLKYEYSNNLMGFEVLYKTSTSESFIALTGYPEGTNPGNNGYNYELRKTGGVNSIIIKFGKNTSSFKPAIRSTIKVIIYTTMGAAGNMSFPSIDENPLSLSFSMSQDKNNDYEMAITRLTPKVGTRSNQSSGGKNQMTFEEIRNHIISRKNSSEIITDSSLKRKAAEYGFSSENTRHDVIGVFYKLSSYLKDSDGSFIASGCGNFVFYFDDLMLRNEMKARLIKPSHVFVYDGNNYNFRKTPDTYKEYVSKYKNNSELQVSFPYFIKIESTSSFKINVYDLACNDYYYTSVIDNLSIVLDNISINNIYIRRNPSAEKVKVDNGKMDGVYIISFNASVGENTINALKTLDDPDNYIKFRLAFVSKNNDSKKFWCDAIINRTEDGDLDIDDKKMSISLSATLFTTNNINSFEELCFSNYSLKSFPINTVSVEEYYMPMEMDMYIYIIFQSEAYFKYRTKDYDKYLTNEELKNNYYVGIIYELENVVFGKSLTNIFNFNGDVLIQDTDYDIYTEPVYKTYEKDEFATDETGRLLYEVKEYYDTDGQKMEISTPKIKHRKGDYVLDLEGNKIILHDIGDAKLDENGEVVKLTKNKYYCIINDVPFYNRIYNVNNKYFDIINSYESMISKIESMRSIVLKGITLSLSVKGCFGSSKNWYYFNKISREYENLDNMAISIKIGVKFNSELVTSDKEFNKTKIITLTEKYIKENATTEFSYDGLSTYLKKEIPSIVSLTLFNINNYDSNVTEYLVKKLEADSIDNEILCLKHDVDDVNSSYIENSENIIFKPAIDIVDIP